LDEVAIADVEDDVALAEDILCPVVVAVSAAERVGFDAN